MEKRKLIGRGRTADVYELDENKVLKLYQKTVSQKLIREEYVLSHKVSEVLDCAPKTYEMIEEDTRHGIIYENIRGETLLQHISKKPWKLAYYAKEMARLQYRIHQEKVDGIPDGKKVLIESIKKTHLDKQAIIIQYVSALPQDDKLCHGDFHPDNIIVRNEDKVVIDWSNAYSGSALSDVARTYLLIRTPFMDKKINFLMRLVISIMKNRLSHYYLKEYRRLSNIKLKEIKMWFLPVYIKRLLEEVPGERKWLEKNIHQYVKALK